MKYIFSAILTTIICGLFVHAVVAAPAINELTADVGKKSGYDTAVDKYTLSRTVGKIIQAAMALIGMIFLVLTIYAGFLWLTAGGNDENVTKAKDILKQAVIGLIIVLSAYSITVFVAIMMSSSQNDQGFWGVFSNSGFGFYTGLSTGH
ncbi:MAG: pilin [Candidatus Magasanikbacteria bacterium]|jgi:hypothetical protein